MRRILFRGKRTDNKQWTYGYYFHIWDKAYILWGMTNNVPDMIEVDPETVGEYTGLNDSENTLIFEDDIVQSVESGDIQAEFPFTRLYEERENGTLGRIEGNMFGDLRSFLQNKRKQTHGGKSNDERRSY